MKKLSILAILFTAVMALGHVALNAQTGPVKGGELIVGARVDIESLDPATVTRASTQQLMNNVFDALVRQKQGDPKIYPGLATSWEVSADQKSYTFKLRRGVKFHDGTPFNAEAVCFSFDRIADPATQARIAKGALSDGYKSCDVVDEFTARVNFKEPYGPFLFFAAREVLAMVSPTAVKKYGKDFFKHPVGTGPFMFKEWVPLQHVKFVRNPDYNWASPIYKHNGPAYLDGFTWKIIPEAGTRVGALFSGEIHIAEDPPAVEYQKLKDDPNFRVIKSTKNGTFVAVQLNFKKFPTNELAVRQAMQYAANQEVIVQTLYKGMHEAGRELLDPTTLGYNPKIKTMYSYNPQKAKDLLEKAGWKVGPDGIRVKNGKRLEIVFIMQPTFDAYSWGPFLQAQLREVGIDMKLRKEPISRLMPLYRKGEHNGGDVAWTYPDPHALKQLYYSEYGTTGFAYSHYDNPEVDKLLIEGQTELDPDKRAEIYRKAQEIITKDAVYLPILRNVAIFAVNAKVKDIAYTPIAYSLFYDTYIEK